MDWSSWFKHRSTGNREESDDKTDSPVLAPVSPDFIGEGVLSSHAERITPLAGDRITGFADVMALRQVRFSDYSFGTSTQSTFSRKTLWQSGPGAYIWMVSSVVMWCVITVLAVWHHFHFVPQREERTRWVPRFGDFPLKLVVLGLGDVDLSRLDCTIEKMVRMWTGNINTPNLLRDGNYFTDAVVTAQMSGSISVNVSLY